MGTRGARFIGVETAASLREFGEALSAVAQTLDVVAEAMLQAGVREISVRYAPAAREALSQKIARFRDDAKIKARAAGARLPPGL